MPIKSCVLDEGIWVLFGGGGVPSSLHEPGDFLIFARVVAELWAADPSKCPRDASSGAQSRALGCSGGLGSSSTRNQKTRTDSTS